MLCKNLPENELKNVFLKRFFLDAVAAIRFMFGAGGISSLWAVVRAHASFWRTRKRTLVKRKYIKQTQVSQIYKRNIVLDYYLRGKKKFHQLNEKNFS